MKILWIATKAPWPPVDGGRLLLANTLKALKERGHAVTLVAPCDPRHFHLEALAVHLRGFCTPHLVPAEPRAFLWALVLAQLQRLPLSVVRHRLPAVRQAVRQLLATQSFDLVQIEQVQALGALPKAVALPVVLRAQNVESELWRQTLPVLAETTSLAGTPWARLKALPGRRPWLELEARRLARFEGAAVRRCAATLALTAEDAACLAQLAGNRGPLPEVVAAPFDCALPGAAAALPGAPAVVLLGSAGWLPNTLGARWFLARVWPTIATALPQAVLHAFAVEGARAQPGVVCHSAPQDSRDAFAPGAIVVVPLHVASGVRIKILEAWARGLPVVATPEAARGLGGGGRSPQDGVELLLARDGPEFAAALTRLQAEPELVRALIAAGRQRLRTTHDPSRVAAALENHYVELLTRTARARPGDPLLQPRK